MKKHKKLIIDAHLATIRHSITEIHRSLEKGDIVQAKNWTTPISSATEHINRLTSDKEVAEDEK